MHLHIRDTRLWLRWPTSDGSLPTFRPDPALRPQPPTGHRFVSGRGSTSSSPVEDRVVMRTGGKATALTFWLGGGCQTGRLSRSMAATGLCPLAGNELLNLRRGR